MEEELFSFNFNKAFGLLTKFIERLPEDVGSPQNDTFSYLPNSRTPISEIFTQTSGIWIQTLYINQHGLNEKKRIKG